VSPDGSDLLITGWILTLHWLPKGTTRLLLREWAFVDSLYGFSFFSRWKTKIFDHLAPRKTKVTANKRTSRPTSHGNGGCILIILKNRSRCEFDLQETTARWEETASTKWNAAQEAGEEGQRMRGQRGVMGGLRVLNHHLHPPPPRLQGPSSSSLLWPETSPRLQEETLYYMYYIY